MTKGVFLRCMVLVAILFVYLFFSLAATKMVAFTLIVAPFLFLGWGSLMERAVAWVERRTRSSFAAGMVRFLIPSMMAFMVLKLDKIERYHTMKVPHDNNNRIGNLVEMELIGALEEKLEGQYIIFNTRITAEGHIPFMFYTEHLAFDFVPSREELKKAIGTGKRVAVLDLGKLPAHVKDHPKVRILKVEGADRLIKRFY